MSLFKKRNSKSIQIQNAVADEVQKQRKEDLEDIILILKQIQDANNRKAKGQGSFVKTSLDRQELINNITTLAIEKTEDKIKDLAI